MLVSLVIDSVALLACHRESVHFSDLHNVCKRVALALVAAVIHCLDIW